MKTITKFIYFGFTAFALACFAHSQTARAVTPAPDGGYPGGNTAEGQAALLSLTSGGYNTGIGYLSLGSINTNSFNTGVGAGALLTNTADQNTATGAGALLHNTTGSRNTAHGAFALFSNQTPGDNTAIGADALINNVYGDRNTAVGSGTLTNTVFAGSNIAIGYHAGNGLTTGCCNIDIDSPGVPDEDHTTRIGQVQTRAFIAGIHGVQTVNTAIPVFVDYAGQLGTLSSSKRCKKEIKPMAKASESILALKPVTFQYRNDNTSTPQFGLIAEEVADVNPSLVARDKNGEIYTVRYDAVNAMLLNEFLKEHRTVQKQGATIAELKDQIAVLTAELQSVKAQLELHKPAPQTAENND